MRSEANPKSKPAQERIGRSSHSELILRGRVIDGTGAPPVEAGEVVIEDGRIRSIGLEGHWPVKSGTRVIVADGTILPGLIDLHAHPKAHYLSWFLAAGVTSIRDATNDLQSIEAFESVGPHRPRVIWAGPLLDGERAFFRQLFTSLGLPESMVHEMVRRPGNGLDGSVAALVVTTPEEAEAAVDLLAARGAGVIKLYEQLRPEVFAAAIRRAMAHGLPTMADLGMMTTRGLRGAEVDLIQAAEFGVGSIEHGSGAALAYQRLGGDPFAEDLDRRLIDKLAQALNENDVALVPTLMVHRYRAERAPPDLVAEWVPLADLGGPVAEGLRSQWERMQGRGDRREAAAEFRLQRMLLARLHQTGGRVGAGTDAPAGSYNVPGGSLHQELELYVGAGLSPLEALHTATGAAATILGATDVGVIAPGHAADLVVVDGDPSRDVRATRDVRMVILGGDVLSIAELLAQALAEGERILSAVGGGSDG